MRFLIAGIAASVLLGCGPTDKQKAEALEAAKLTDLRKPILGQLKDPDSAKFSDELISNSGALCGFVNAKNSYGGYTGNTEFIVVPGKFARLRGSPMVPLSDNAKLLVDGERLSAKYTEVIAEQKRSLGEPVSPPLTALDYFNELFDKDRLAHCIK